AHADVLRQPAAVDVVAHAEHVLDALRSDSADDRVERCEAGAQHDLRLVLAERCDLVAEEVGTHDRADREDRRGEATQRARAPDHRAEFVHQEPGAVEATQHRDHALGQRQEHPEARVAPVAAVPVATVAAVQAPAATTTAATVAAPRATPTPTAPTRWV